MDKELWDVLILGTGPAGLQAAIHAARKKVRLNSLKHLPPPIHVRHVNVEYDEIQRFLRT